ncbi:MAG: arginine--tRNA ligase [Candidatus Komeilibacteria bacterium]
MTTKQKLEKIIKEALVDITDETSVDFDINYPNEDKFGDYATNIAMVLAKELKKNPVDIAGQFKEKLNSSKELQKIVSKVEVVNPGFINFFLSKEYLEEQLKEINKSKEYGTSKQGISKKVQIEFISANPTGPLTLANGRGGFLGDALANIMRLAGYKVDREYLINDAGNQITTLGLSSLSAVAKIPDSPDYYHGDYVNSYMQEMMVEAPNYVNLPAEDIGAEFANYLFSREIKPVIENGMKIKFDKYFSEQKELHDKGKVENVIEFLKKKNLTYVQDDALWFKTTGHGDDKDRVLVTSDGRYTYMAVDIAYHLNKFKRGYDRVIDIWGADHGGYVDRMLAGVSAIGFEGQLEIIIMQLVKLMSGGKEVRMSKRKGEYVTMQYLLDLLPLDVVRWFFLMYNPNTHMLFDLDLAKDKSEKNPVYYVQYAHARISSILSQAKGYKKEDKKDMSDEEISFVKVLLRWPEIVQDVSQIYQLNSVTTYATLVAESFHKYYQNYRVIDNEKVNESRLEIISAYKKILISVLSSLGISAPDKM